MCPECGGRTFGTSVSDEQIISDRLLKSIQTMGNPEAYKGSTEEQYGTDWFGEVPAYNSAQWDHVFSDGAMFLTDLGNC